MMRFGHEHVENKIKKKIKTREILRVSKFGS